MDAPGHELKTRPARDRHPPSARHPAHRPAEPAAHRSRCATASRRSSGSSRRTGSRCRRELSAARRFSMACPALPTCGLAVAESERAIPALLDQFEAELDALGLRDAPLTIRMTGCPNGCARPYTADLAFVGRSLGLYNVYVGGGLAGDRLVDLYRADVPTEELLADGSAAAGALGDGARGGRRSGRLLPAAHGRSRPAHRRHRPRASHHRSGAAGGGPVSSRALVLAAHGSRRDPAANAPSAGSPKRSARHRLFDEVAVAFHQGEPGFDTVLDEWRRTRSPSCRS